MNAARGVCRRWLRARLLPDHWVPLAVLGRTRRYPLARLARLAGLAGIAHVLVSIVLGAVIIAVGLQFRSSVQSAQDSIIGSILILTGLGFAALEPTGHGHHHEHDHATSTSITTTTITATSQGGVFVDWLA